MQVSLGRDFRSPENAVSVCSSCGADAFVDPRLSEDGATRDDEGKIIALEFKCENNHCFSEVVDHPDSDVEFVGGESS
jgi:hypothetical protein